MTIHEHNGPRVTIMGALLLSILLLFAAPALAHGEESHEEETAAAQQVEAPATPAPFAKTAAEPEPRVTLSSALKYLHHATVHFPIGLLLAAALVELLAWRRRSQGLQHAANVMLAAGAIGAVVAATFGWIHTGAWLGGGTTMQLHRWIGTGLAALALLAWSAVRAADRRAPLRALLLLIAALVTVQGYLGGELAHGPHHLAAAH